jgi:predicted ATPase/class 3 adenylate cyclase
MPDHLKSGSLVFFFSDLEGSTQLWEQHPALMRPALARHDDILQHCIQSAGGQIVKTTGDGVLAGFGTAAAAVLAALCTQRTLLAANWGVLGTLRVRLGLHVGEAEVRDGDYYGPAVNRAARLMAIAHGGQTLLSAASAALVADGLPPDASLRDLGEHRLKDLSQPERVYQLCVPDLEGSFPPLRSLTVARTNLPVQFSRLIGRQAELAEARQVLAEPDCRLLTLTGPGGTGKTRLSLQVAADEVDRFGDGCWLVELAPLADGALVAAAIASVLGVREPPGRSLHDTLLDFLRAKHMLLVLDNCEHLVEATARLAKDLLSSSTRLKLLASSREPLGIQGEQVFRVPSLGLPEVRRDGRAEPDAVRRSESGQLFVERAAAGQPRFALTAQNSAAVAQIVQRLDGIPLAIELAAARVRVLSPEQIAARLDDRFRLLTGGSRTALPRHQTLLAAIEWSYQLLSEAERVLLRRLSVFAGGWTLEAAEAVVGDEADSGGAIPGGPDPAPAMHASLGAGDVLDLLTYLADKSLIVVNTTGEPRYRLLETIRQFARDRLLEAGEAAAVRQRHLNYYLLLAERTEPLLFERDQLVWLGRLASEHDNLRTALAWGLESQPDTALRLANGLRWYWHRHGHEREGCTWLQRALDQAAASDDVHTAEHRGRALAGLGQLALILGDHAGARQAAEGAAALLENSGRQADLAIALSGWGLALLYMGQIPPARELLMRGEQVARAANDDISMTVALSAKSQLLLLIDNDFAGTRAVIDELMVLAHKMGDRWISGEVTFGLAFMAQSQADWPAARRYFSEALEILAEIGARSFANMARSGLADASRHTGDLAEAETHYKEVVAYWHGTGHRAAIARCLECLAFVAGAQDRSERAGMLYGAAEAQRFAVGAVLMPYEQAEYDHELALLRSRLGAETAAFDAAWQAGKYMPLDDILALALADDSGA